MKMSGGLVVLVLLAGCGGSGGDSTEKDAKAADTATATQTATATETATEEASGGGDTMSAAAWSKRVEAICVKSEAKAFKAGKKLGQKSAADGDSKQELTYKVLALTSKLLDPWVDQIDSLPKPEGREDDANTFVSTMRDVGDLLGKTATAVKDNDAANGKKLVKQLATKTLAARSQAKSLDIEKCNPAPNGVGSTS
jgi:hypothetical protein